MSESESAIQSAAELDALDWSKPGGLLPAIVQDAGSGEIRMLGWMSRAALEATLATRRVTFHSRTRDALWTKGEVSGNSLELVSIATDCDRDALLVLARPHGPTCHTGRPSCFGALAARGGRSTAWLERLEQRVLERIAAGDPASYTARLVASGVRRVAQKVGEEAVETALAGASGEREELVSEAADLLFHLVVLLAAQGVGVDQVAAELDRRAGD